MTCYISVSLVRISCLHPFPAIATVAHQYGHTSGVVFISQASPADCVRVIKVIILSAIGVVSAGMEKRVDQEPVRRHTYVICVDMTKIAMRAVIYQFFGCWPMTVHSIHIKAVDRLTESSAQEVP